MIIQTFLYLKLILKNKDMEFLIKLSIKTWSFNLNSSKPVKFVLILLGDKNNTVSTFFIYIIIICCEVLFLIKMLVKIIRNFWNVRLLRNLSHVLSVFVGFFPFFSLFLLLYCRYFKGCHISMWRHLSLSK